MKKVQKINLVQDYKRKYLFQCLSLTVLSISIVGLGLVFHAESSLSALHMSAVIDRYKNVSGLSRHMARS